jgi:glycosyltransferase involved in cell wall biosynthesis
MQLVSLVIPTLNEDLAEPLRKLSEYLRHLQRWTFEIIVVDDSRDDFRAHCRAAVSAAPLANNIGAQFVTGTRSGKGAAVRKGIVASQGTFVFAIDADFPAPMHCIEDFLRLLEEGADIVIAERVLERSFPSVMRWLVSRGLLVIQRAFVFQSSEFCDTQCGFKAFRGSLIRNIALQQIVTGGMYDLEYLYVARRVGRRVEKISIAAAPELRPSRINVWKCLRRDPFDVIRIKVHGMLGGYRSASACYQR